MTATIDDSFSPRQLQILLQGLLTLEGALKAIEQPLPDQMNELKEILNTDLESFSTLENITLTTVQVARILHCTIKRVQQLASEGEIKVAEVGKKGRSYSSHYFANSVKEYAVKKAQKI
jgi:hypothetical protein